MTEEKEKLVKSGEIIICKNIKHERGCCYNLGETCKHTYSIKIQNIINSIVDETFNGYTTKEINPITSGVDLNTIWSVLGSLFYQPFIKSKWGKELEHADTQFNYQYPPHYQDKWTSGKYYYRYGILLRAIK